MRNVKNALAALVVATFHLAAAISLNVTSTSKNIPYSLFPPDLGPLSNYLL